MYSIYLIMYVFYLLKSEFIYWDLYLFVFKPALKYPPWTVYLIISCM
jgi:hypothetical protein